MTSEDTEVSPTAQQAWDDLPNWWRQAVERIRLECEANGANFDDYRSLAYVRHLDLLPLVHIMSRHETLGQLYPFTSHARLGMRSAPINQNQLENHPQIEALANGSFRVLQQQTNPQSGRWEELALFTGTAEETVDFVAAEIIARRNSPLCVTDAPAVEYPK